MKNEVDYKAYLETLSKEEVIETCLYWRRIDSNWYWKLYHKHHTEKNLMTEL